jgi:hypothetical protein
MRIDPQSLARGIHATIRRPILAALPLAVAATSALVPAATPAAALSAPSVTLYQDINYLGYSGPPITLFADTPDLKTVGFNDVASSLAVGAGTKVALFQHANYLGACAVFTANDPDLRDNIVDNLVLNDNVSSVRFGHDCPLQLYDSAGYNGPFRTFWYEDLPMSGPDAHSVPNLGQYSFDNTTASLRVPPGKTVTAWSDPNYKGVCEQFTADDSDLYGNVSGNARISSVQFGAHCPPTQVILFENSNYDGEFQILYPPTDPQSCCTDYDLSTLVSATGNFGNRVSSVYLSGGPAVSLFDYYFGGTGCTEFTVSDPDLHGTQVSNDSADDAEVYPRPISNPTGYKAGGFQQCDIH